MEEIGFDLTHVYGLTEIYGPAAVCAKQQEWDALDDDAARRAERAPGRALSPAGGGAVLDPDTLAAGAVTTAKRIGEIMFRGNICMKGYLKNERATRGSFRGGWFHTGDLGVRTPDGYIRIRDRSKDIIISGGENISSIEVEDTLYRHPAVSVAAVVAMADPKWGEVPCAFVELKEGAGERSGNHRALPAISCRLQGAKSRALRRTAEDVDRKDSEVRTARADQERRK